MPPEAPLKSSMEGYAIDNLECQGYCMLVKIQYNASNIILLLPTSTTSVGYGLPSELDPWPAEGQGSPRGWMLKILFVTIPCDERVGSGLKKMDRNTSCMQLLTSENMNADLSHIWKRAQIKELKRKEYMNAKSQKKGGSALKRLKTTLKEVGVIGPTSRSSISKKQRKRGTPIESGKNDIKTKLNQLNDEINPFELKVTRMKHDVLGKRVKGVQGRPGLNRQIGIEKRKKTLLVEMENKNKAGGMIDRRFGENDPTLSPEDKMLERFTREKQRQSKLSLFNLGDEDDLTHYGQSLSLHDDFNEPDLVSSDEGIIDKDTVTKNHFVDHKKSKVEVMKEIISKSKMHKYERMIEKETDERIRNELDNEVDEIRNILIPQSTAKNLESQEVKFTSRNQLNSEIKLKQGDKDDKYDRHVRELAFEKRGRPTDRTKTEEEIALEEKEKLEKLEFARKRRMEGLDSESEDDKDKHKRQKREPIADDLEDDYISDDYNLYGLDDTLQVAFEEDELSNANIDKEDELNNVKIDKGNENFAKKRLDKSNKLSVTSKENKDKKELPYTFPCPTSLENFLKIIDNIDDNDVPIVIHRIRVLYNIKLSADNREKLEKLFPVLMDYILYRSSEEDPIPMILINKFVGHIFDLAHQLPEIAKDYFIEKIIAMQINLTKGLGVKKSKSLFPSASELILLRISLQVFPSSDFHHPVVTPTILLMGQYLAQCPLSFVCLAPKGTFTSSKSIPGTFPLTEELIMSFHIKDPSKINEVFPLDFSQLLGITSSEKNYSDIFNKDEFRVSVLNAVLHLISKYAKLYSSTSAFIELFSPISKIISLYPIDKFSEIVKAKFSDVLGKLENLQKFTKESRRPLELQHHRPIPIPTYIPKFEEKFSVDKHYDPDRERAKLNKLRSQYKKERKGAIRELRKDNHFIARQSSGLIKEKDAAYKKKINRIMENVYLQIDINSSSDLA
ncbi:10902_t:CDS:10 [Diversispora eburnea]|uniref:10902_t:CDS:1 n=1 Tax=Diversispora eburnea TaxID=1213867 RepID=A0A9N8YI95_9GLOM|nr:10902_t:CDS:10 [Diversispora eburnea]